MSDEEEKNKVMVRRYFEEVWVKDDLAAVDEFMAADYVEHPIPSGLRYANAGHDLPYLRRRSGEDAQELRARGMPLGLMPEMSYEEKETSLSEGESVLFYSDGLVEAHDPKRREMFGFPRLRELVAEHDADAEERSLVEFLMDELRSFTGDGWEQEDDITLVTLRRSAASRKPSENTSTRGTWVNKGKKKGRDG